MYPYCHHYSHFYHRAVDRSPTGGIDTSGLFPPHRAAGDMHGAPVTALLFFEDGKLASASEDGTVKVQCSKQAPPLSKQMRFGAISINYLTGFIRFI